MVAAAAEMTVTVTTTVAAARTKTTCMWENLCDGTEFWCSSLIKGCVDYGILIVGYALQWKLELEQLLHGFKFEVHITIVLLVIVFLSVYCAGNLLWVFGIVYSALQLNALVQVLSELYCRISAYGDVPIYVDWS
ncbi:hypothetical protein Tco_0588738 [Tanacetum coccineum]